jgi:hypothetical protein
MSRLHNNRSRFKPAFLPLGWLAMLASIDPAADEAVKQRPSDNANADLGALRSSAQCK